MLNNAGDLSSFPVAFFFDYDIVLYSFALEFVIQLFGCW